MQREKSSRLVRLVRFRNCNFTWCGTENVIKLYKPKKTTKNLIHCTTLTHPQDTNFSKMSFVDLATLTLHRRNELEARTKVFLGKCDQAIKDIEKLKLQAQNFVLHLNCEPSELKERFLSCMKNLDEYTYLITDFNLSVNKLEELTTSEYTPVHDNAVIHVLPTPQCGPINLIDVLSEPRPSTSTACSNLCPSKGPKRKRVPKEDQLLIAFSSTSSSSESVPLNRTDHTKEVEVQCELTTDMKNMTIKAPLTPAQDSCNLPAQKVLQTDHSYNATIMSIDDGSFWVITESTDEVCTLMKRMTDYYKSNHFDLTLDELTALTYCAFYDEESDCFYRALFIKLVDEETMITEVFLVDTGEVRTGAASCVQPLEPQFCTSPPYARCCHLAGIDMLSHQNKDLMAKQEQFMKEYIGTNCTIEVDDNTSESLGVYVILPSKRVLNEILIQEGFAQPIDKPKSEIHQVVQGPPEVLPEDSDFDITQCPEFEDPVEAVTICCKKVQTRAFRRHWLRYVNWGPLPTRLEAKMFRREFTFVFQGYSNRDEADICKHYKGGPEKTCFKGSRCTKKHILKHPDGWTLDRVEVPAKITSVALPPPDTWLKVVVTYVCHFNRLYVQFVINKQLEHEIPSFGVMLPPSVLPALVRDMNSPATRITYKPLTITPAPGELVAALYPLDNQWYRARVLTVTRADQSVEVMYIDYGNVVWVKEDQIRVLEPRYMALPAQAVRCALAGVRARSSCSRLWADAKAALARMVQDRTLDAHVISRDYDELTVELFDAEGYSIAEQLATHEVIELDDYAVTDDTKVTQKVIPA